MWNDVANQVETSRDSFDDATSFSLRPVDRLNVARGCLTAADRLIFQRSSVSPCRLLAIERLNGTTQNRCHAFRLASGNVR